MPEPLNADDKAFKKREAVLHYCIPPKGNSAEVIGAFPLAMGLEFGQIVLSVALLGILFTASLDALGIDSSCRYLLCKQ